MSIRKKSFPYSYRHINVKCLLLLFVALVLVSCDYIKQRHQTGVVAEAEGHTLTEQDLYHLTQGLDSADSSKVASDYIRQWAVGILEYNKAANSRSEEIEKLVEDYRRSLYLHEYEQHLVSRHMSKQVSDSIVERFYEEHKEQFVLKENIVKGILVVFSKGAPKQDKLRRWLQEPDDENLEYIEKYMYQYGSGYELFLSEWRTANQILMRMPIEPDNLLAQLKKKKLIEVEDSLSVYWLEVSDKLFAGDYMPIEFAKGEITQIILAKRQVAFLEEERDKLYHEALRYGKLKVVE